MSFSALARSPVLRHWVLSLLAGVALGVTLGAAAWLALDDGPTRPPEQVAVTIPSGTAERIAAGAPAPSIPTDVRLVEGDTLVLQNADVVTHRIGAYTLAPGATLWVPVSAADGGTFACTFHAGGAIGLDVRGRSEPAGVVAAGLLFGLPIGLVLGGVSWIVRNLDEPSGSLRETGQDRRGRRPSGRAGSDQRRRPAGDRARDSLALECRPADRVPWPSTSRVPQEMA